MPLSADWRCPHVGRRASAVGRGVGAFVLALACLLGVHAAVAQPERAVIDAVDRFLTARHEDGCFHGAVAVGWNGDVVYGAGFGPADRDEGVRNDPATQFLIGSLTKQFTAALVLTLVRDGRLDRFEPVSTYLPRYAGPAGDQITLHHLLAHRSGLPSHADVRGAARGEPEAVDALDFEPGTRYAYSNAGYVLLGLIVEAVTGRTYAEALRERVLLPAGVDGAVSYPGDAGAGERRATGYVDAWWSWRYRRAPTVDPHGPFSAGALYASPTALVQWTHALHTGSVLPDSLLQAMTTPHSGDGYGYGLFVSHDEGPGGRVEGTHHRGDIAGFTAALRRVRLPGGDTVVVAVLDNTQGSATMETAEDVQTLLVGPTTTPN